VKPSALPYSKEKDSNMGKEIPQSLERIRNGEALNLAAKGFTNLASLTAAGLTPAKCKGALVFLSAGGTGAVACLAFSDGTNWKQVAIGANAV
jgi:hypothetical protein